ncbi:unnamed protein product [Rhodiola kirilowii]
MDGTTRVYERGKTRNHISSWVPSDPVKHNSTPVDAAAVASCYLLDAQSRVLDDADCWTTKCAYPQALEPNEGHDKISESLLLPDEPKTCHLNQCTVVRGGISVPLPLHCDLNEVPEVAPDEESLVDHVFVTPVLHCDLNNIPEIVADEEASTDMISEVAPFKPFLNMEAEKGEPNDGIIGGGNIDVNMDELVILRLKGADNANFNKDKLQTDSCLLVHNTAGEQKHNDHEHMMKLQTPHQKPKRKKHRPKVLVDGYKPRAQKKKSSSTFRKVKELPRNKKKYLQLSHPLTSYSEIDPDAPEKMTIQSTRKSTKRLLDFDSKGLLKNTWYPSKPKDVNQLDINGEARGQKRGYSSMISNAINFNTTEYDSHLAYSGLRISASSSSLPFIPFLEISKRRRTTKGRSSLSSIECWLSTAKFLAEPGDIKGCLEEIMQSECHVPQAKRSKGIVRIRRLSFSSLLFKCRAQKYVPVQDLITEVRVHVLRKKRSRKRLRKGKAWSNIIKMDQLYQRNLVPYNHQRSFFKSAASAREGACELPLSVDEIVERLHDLNINRENNVNYRKSTMLARYNSRFQVKKPYLSSFDMINGEENMIVPYRRDGAIVPFVRKKHPRPRVDLDAETNRVWNLLLENINNPGIDGSDEETARRWEDERNVFKERANLFIARMHLIQGDRRFSPWKGSVLDSVIGVFLTQNVSDHLSSSAFMSLAAKFPLMQKSNDKLCHEKKADLSNDRYESSVTNSGQNYVIISHPEDDFDDPVNSILTIENFATHRPSGDSSNGSKPSDGELGRSEISANSCVLKTAEEALVVIGATRSAEVNVSSRSYSDSLTQIFGRTRLPFEEIPVVCPAFETKYENNNHSTSQEVLENLVPREGHDSRTCEVKREPAAVLSHIRSESKDDPWSLSSGVEVFGIPRNHPLHLTSDLGAENLEHLQNLEKGSAVLEESDAQSKEQAGRRFSFTERAIASRPACQGACRKSDIGCHPCLLPATNRNIEFPAIKGSDKHTPFHNNASRKKEADAHKAKTRRVGRNIDHTFDWDSLRKHAQANNKRENSANSMDSIDYEALRNADVSEIAKVIKRRGMNSMLAERIQDFVNGLVAKHGSTNLEWLRDVLPDQAKEYLLTVRGLGLKSVECVRLLTLHQHAFPVDTNVGRIAVRLGWVPLQPLPESLQLHLLEQYPILESIQKHLWPRLCKLDQKTLYELHYQMITFGKVFCTKTKPNCNSCPMRGDCRHFASEFASSRLALPSPKNKRVINIPGKREATPLTHGKDFSGLLQWFSPQQVAHKHLDIIHPLGQAHCEPIIEVPTSPELIFGQTLDRDIEDIGSNSEDSDEIPTIKLNISEFAQNLQNYVTQNMEVQEAELSKALIALTPEAASIPARKLKNASGLRTEHQVYVLPDSHPLLEKFDKREPDDPSPYLLAIWTPGETAKSIQLPESKCNQEHGKLCNEETCLLCNSVRESEFQIVRGTILIPCRTAMRGSFPLNGTYFQVNEVFADFHSSHKPIEVPRNLIWNLPTRIVFFGTSVPTIFRGMLTERIQQCFWKGFICVRGFDPETRAPRPLAPRLHTAKSLLPKPMTKH